MYIVHLYAVFEQYFTIIPLNWDLDKEISLFGAYLSLTLHKQLPLYIALIFFTSIALNVIYEMKDNILYTNFMYST